MGDIFGKLKDDLLVTLESRRAGCSRLSGPISEESKEDGNRRVSGSGAMLCVDFRLKVFKILIGRRAPARLLVGEREGETEGEDHGEVASLVSEPPMVPEGT